MQLELKQQLINNDELLVEMEINMQMNKMDANTEATSMGSSKCDANETDGGSSCKDGDAMPSNEAKASDVVSKKIVCFNFSNSFYSLK